MCVEVYAKYVCVCRMRDNTLHRAASKRVKVVFVMCIWDEQRKRSNGGGATRFEFLNFFEFSYNILKKVPKDTVRVGDDGLRRAKNAPI